MIEGHLKGDLNDKWEPTPQGPREQAVELLVHSSLQGMNCLPLPISANSYLPFSVSFPKSIRPLILTLAF